MCACKKHTFLQRCLIVKSKQSRLEPVTRPATPPISKYMKDYMEYSTEKRRQRVLQQFASSKHMAQQPPSILAASHPKVTLSRKSSGRKTNGAVTMSVKRRKSFKSSKLPHSHNSCHVKVAGGKSSPSSGQQTLNRSVTEVETLLPPKKAPFRESKRQKSSENCSCSQPTAAVTSEKTQRDHQDPKLKQNKCCGSKRCTNQR